MTSSSTTRAIAFAGRQQIAAGSLADVTTAAKQHLDADPRAILLVFDAFTSEPIELDLRGTLDDVLARLPRPEPESDQQAAPRKPGRPKLGVVAREVTLLPRHWEWLSSQPGGASVTLRKLVEAARKEAAEPDRIRAAQESAYRFMFTMAGNEAGFEDATRALFSGDRERFGEMVAEWPVDIRAHSLELADRAFAS